MIKIDHGSIEVEGSGIELIVELAHVMRYLGHDKKIISKEMMSKMLDSAYMSHEELERENKEAIENIKKRLDMIFSAFEDDEDCEHCSDKDTCTDPKNKYRKENKSQNIDDIFKDIFGDEK